MKLQFLALTLISIFGGLVCARSADSNQISETSIVEIPTALLRNNIIEHNELDLYHAWLTMQASGRLRSFEITERLQSQCSTRWAVENKHYELEFWKFLKNSNARRHQSVAIDVALHGSLELLKLVVDEDWSLINSKVMYAAASNRNLEAMKWLREHGCELEDYMYNAAIYYEDMEMLEWLKENECPFVEENFQYAAFGGNYTVMSWLKTAHCPWDEKTFEFAAANGNLANMKWLRALKCPLSTKTLVHAAARGIWENIEWLLEIKCPVDKESIFSAAAWYGDLSIMQNLYYMGFRISTDSLDMAAINGNIANLIWLLEHTTEKLILHTTFSKTAQYGTLDTLKWLSTNNFPWSEDTLHKALSRGDTEIIQWLLAMGAPWHHAATSRVAASAESLDTLIWLKDQGYEWDLNTFDYAVSAGNITIMEWLKENGCPFLHSVMYEAAAKKGDLAVLEWLHEKNVPRGWTAYADAIMGGHLHVLQWLESHDFPMIPVDYEWPFIHAMSGGNMRVLDWLRDNGYQCTENVFAIAAARNDFDLVRWFTVNKCPMGDTVFTSAVQYADFEIIKYLTDQGCPSSSKTFLAAATRGSLWILKWLYNNGVHWDRRTFTAAVRKGNLQCVKWLYEHHCPRDDSNIINLAPNVEVAAWLTGRIGFVSIHRVEIFCSRF